jgi:hypothetical protein
MYYKADEQTRMRIAGSIYQLRPPYVQLEITPGLKDWADIDPEAAQVLQTLWEQRVRPHRASEVLAYHSQASRGGR